MHADGFVTSHARVFDDIALCIEIHVGRRRGWGLLTIVDEVDVAIRGAEQHESAATQIPSWWVNHGERETGGDRGIHCVPAGLHDRSEEHTSELQSPMYL